MDYLVSKVFIPVPFCLIYSSLIYYYCSSADNESDYSESDYNESDYNESGYSWPSAFNSASI